MSCHGHYNPGCLTHTSSKSIITPCLCQCNYGCTCQCNYSCTCQCNYYCNCRCNYREGNNCYHYTYKCSAHVDAPESCAIHGNTAQTCTGQATLITTSKGICAAHVTGVTTCASHITTGFCTSHTTLQCVAHDKTICDSHSDLGVCPSDYACAVKGTCPGQLFPGTATVFDDLVDTDLRKITNYTSLRTAINNERGRRGLNPVSFDSNLNVDEEELFNFVLELKNAINAIKVQSWTQEYINSSSIITVRGQIQELRDKINSLETDCLCNCNYCTCECNYCTCHCNYACTCVCNYDCTCQCNYACTCNCNYKCTCQCNYCTCNCNYACTCQCNYCTCNCNYSCTCNCNYGCTCNCAYHWE